MVFGFLASWFKSFKVSEFRNIFNVLLEDIGLIVIVLIRQVMALIGYELQLDY